MRAALISMAGQPRAPASDAPLAIAGKMLARRQLDFALAARCESIVALGDGGSAEAIALRHAAEAAGARFQTIRDSHGLLGAVAAGDELLALAPGLLPEAREALEALEKGPAVLVVPAGPGVGAGFERIDLERAWAGAVLVTGAHVERLSSLQADSDTASALMRVALQARVAERRLSDAALADGSWSILSGAGGAAVSDREWLKRHATELRGFAPSPWLARFVLSPLAPRLLASGRSAEMAVLAVLIVLGGAVLAAWSGWAALGLVLVSLGALLAEAARQLGRLRNAPFALKTLRFGVASAPLWLVDAALVACSVLGIEGTWPHRVFPPLVLLGVLHGLGPERRAVLGDRGALALLLAIAAALGLLEPALMLVSLGLLALSAVQHASKNE